MIVLRPFRIFELDEIHHLQSETLAPDHIFSLERLRNELTDTVRGSGRNVVVADAGGRLVGVAGWVSVGEEFYGAPFWATTEEAALILLRHLQERAREAGARWVRTGSWPEEGEKLSALSRSGARVAFEFLTMIRRSTTPLPDTVDFAGLRVIPHASCDVERFTRLYNESFAHVDNAPPMGLETARETWFATDTWPETSFVLADARGEYQAFLLCRYPNHVDSVGVREAFRGRGLARSLMNHALGAAFRTGMPYMRSLVSSQNAASLKLHEALGFEVEQRRAMWQIDLDEG